MLSDLEIQELPEDPELAFVEYERICRKKMYELRDERSWDVEREYVGNVLAFIHEYNIEVDIEEEVPRVYDQFFVYLGRLIDAVNYFVARIRLRANRAELSSGSSILSLDENFRQEIHGYINQIRKILNVVEIPEGIRERLFKRLNQFAAEVDRQRTNIQIFTSLFLESTAVAGKGAENLEPVMRKIERIARVLNEVRERQDQRQIERRSEKKMLQGPPPPSVDDDIPF